MARFSFFSNIPYGEETVEFLVENNVLVELKAIIELENVHLSQALNYLEAFQLETGLLINFGSTRLVFKRLINKQ